MTSLTYGE